MSQVRRQVRQQALDVLAVAIPRNQAYDCFLSRLAEKPHVSEETLKAPAGHVSKKMLERYSHIRKDAKRAAIASLEQPSPPVPTNAGQ